MHTFILAMILHPDIQKRAQVEVDRIVGDERLPSFADRGQLPFIEAIIKECLRWKCVAPLSELSCPLPETDPIKILFKLSLIVPRRMTYTMDISSQRGQLSWRTYGMLTLLPTSIPPIRDKTTE